MRKRYIKVMEVKRETREEKTERIRKMAQKMGIKLKGENK